MRVTLAIALVPLACMASACAGPEPASAEPVGWSVSDDTAFFTDPAGGDWLRFECEVDGAGRPFVHLLRSPTPEIGPHLVQDMTITGTGGEAWVRISAREDSNGALRWSGPVLDSDVQDVFAQAEGEISIALETGGVLTVPAEPAVARAMANCVE